MAAVELEIVVRSTEIDVNGHVNNAKYLEYLEWGREEWYESSGLHYEVLKELGVLTVTANININYRKECVQGERLVVRTSPERIGTKSFVLSQQIMSQSGDVCADALITLVTIDTVTRHSTAVPQRLRAMFEQSEHGQS
ncbi:acyl-CoA thioesterase [Paenibacillus sp. SYP-B4298]|uniref:acyl-CoA thioesterase n=1 Tax=Paenibacillus sp. SYP-B4298 TaxID=2996034 RepID=UPI0022DD309A|nr:thioesterase family protein [Paenibacillus sp. SYP-B4298]